jgi:hypothetical protein
MQPEPATMRREPPYPGVPRPARASALRRANTWPFPATARSISPEISRAALQVLSTTARDWGLAARR